MADKNDFSWPSNNGLATKHYIKIHLQNGRILPWRFYENIHDDNDHIKSNIL